MRVLIQPAFLLGLLVLVVAELVLRCTLSPLQVAAFEYGYHPDSGFQETPDGMVHLVPALTRDFHAQTFSRERPPGVFRIFTLGNSVEYWDAFASHILSNTYPARLATELRQRGIPAESINLGVTGYGLRRNQVLLRKLLTYQPSLIIIKLDTTNEGQDEQNQQRASAFTSCWPKDWLWKSYLVQAGLGFKENRFLLHTLPPTLLASTSSHPKKPDASAPPFNTASQKVLLECLRMARDQGVPVLLITQAYAEHTNGRTQLSDRGLNDYVATLAGPGVSTLSLNQLFASLPLETIFTDHVHLTRPTHQLVARAVADAVQKIIAAP